MSRTVLFQNEYCEWIDVMDPSKEDLELLNKDYGINKYLLNDTLESNHLPKYEENNGVKFFLTRENTKTKKRGLNNISDISTKLSIFLVKEKTIVTVHRTKNQSTDLYKAVISEEKQEITPDFIALNLALRVLDSYETEKNKIVDILETMENEIFFKNINYSEQIRRLFRLKRKTGLNIKILNLSSEWVNQFRQLRISSAQINDMHDKYRNIYNDFEHLNSQISNLISLSLALSDQKANQVMKVLAMYSVYFLPVSFIAGVYGMNFDNMPELRHPYAYFITVGVMGLIALITFLYFRRKRW